MEVVCQRSLAAAEVTCPERRLDRVLGRDEGQKKMESGLVLYAMQSEQGATKWVASQAPVRTCFPSPH